MQKLPDKKYKPEDYHNLLSVVWNSSLKYWEYCTNTGLWCSEEEIVKHISPKMKFEEASEELCNYIDSLSQKLRELKRHEANVVDSVRLQYGELMEQGNYNDLYELKNYLYNILPNCSATKVFFIELETLIDKRYKDKKGIS